MYIKSILNKIPDTLYTISDNAPLIDAARILSEKHNGIVVVCSNDGSMVGIISKTDIVRQISHCHGNSCTTMADKIMT
ncbi:MAG TPA: CBS domain-containing protein, partial [Emcibacteraceae bacterium]|nr:CBS domain-containing protein [Emcibacteraceae bacterium]